jgi:hypothetical protein
MTRVRLKVDIEGGPRVGDVVDALWWDGSYDDGGRADPPMTEGWYVLRLGFVCVLAPDQIEVVDGVVCDRCDGRGWVGACTGSQFAFIGRLAMAGRLPTTVCGKCGGEGRA